jgi:hypothetical protein
MQPCRDDVTVCFDATRERHHEIKQSRTTHRKAVQIFLNLIIVMAHNGVMKHKFFMKDNGFGVMSHKGIMPDLMANAACASAA